MISKEWVTLSKPAGTSSISPTLTRVALLMTSPSNLIPQMSSTRSRTSPHGSQTTVLITRTGITTSTSNLTSLMKPMLVLLPCALLFTTLVTSISPFTLSLKLTAITPVVIEVVMMRNFPQSAVLTTCTLCGTPLPTSTLAALHFLSLAATGPGTVPPSRRWPPSTQSTRISFMMATSKHGLTRVSP